MKKFSHLIKPPQYFVVFFLFSILLILANPAWAATPSATTISADIVEDTITDVLLEGTDPDGDSLTCLLYASSANVKCSVTLSGSDNCTATITITEENYTGSNAYFRYKVSDGANTSSFSRVFLNITPVNDPMVAFDSEEV